MHQQIKTIKSGRNFYPVTPFECHTRRKSSPTCKELSKSKGPHIVWILLLHYMIKVRKCNAIIIILYINTAISQTLIKTSLVCTATFSIAALRILRTLRIGVLSQAQLTAMDTILRARLWARPRLTLGEGIADLSTFPWGDEVLTIFAWMLQRSFRSLCTFSIRCILTTWSWVPLIWRQPLFQSPSLLCGLGFTLAKGSRSSFCFIVQGLLARLGNVHVHRNLPSHALSSSTTSQEILCRDNDFMCPKVHVPCHLHENSVPRLLIVKG